MKLTNRLPKNLVKPAPIDFAEVMDRLDNLENIKKSDPIRAYRKCDEHPV